MSKQSLPQNTLGFYWYFLRQKKILFLGIICCVFIASLREGFSPFFIKLIIDGIHTATEQDKLAYFPYIPEFILVPLCLYFAIQFLNEWLQVAVDLITRQLTPWLKERMRFTLFEYAQQHAPQFFQDNFSGTIANRIAQVATITDGIKDIFIWHFLSPLFRLSFILGIMFYENWVYGFFLVSWLALFFTIIFWTIPPITSAANHFAAQYNRVSGLLVDVFSNIFSVKYFAKAQYEKANLLEAVRIEIEKDKHMQWKLLLQGTFMRNSTTIVIGIMLVLILYGWYHGTVTAGTFAMVMILSLQVGYSANDLGHGIMKAFSQFGQLHNALNLITEPIAIVDSPNSRSLQVSKGDIIFDKVTFNYIEQETLFTDFVLKIKGGTKIGIIGPSGAGKSTVISLLQRFFDIQHGRIQIDGQDITQITQSSLHEQIALVPQDTALFHRTLMDNIRYGKQDATEEEVVAAAKKAHAHEFISELPEGYQTLVGERGVKLSGGQRQRIAIARAILKNAPILILDEATSALDSESERLIQESLQDLMENKTVIAIAHRLSTIKHLDRLIVMEQGQIIEDGTHEELLKQNGTYAKLWRMQSGGFIGE